MLSGSVYDFLQWFEKKIEAFEKVNPILDDINDFKER